MQNIELKQNITQFVHQMNNFTQSELVSAEVKVDVLNSFIGVMNYHTNNNTGVDDLYGGNTAIEIAKITGIIQSSYSNFEKMIALEEFFMYCHEFKSSESTTKVSDPDEFDLSKLKNIKF